MSCLLEGRNSCGNKLLYFRAQLQEEERTEARLKLYEGWNFNSGNYLFTTDTK